MLLTNRPVVMALENELGQFHKVLDHGFVRVIDYMGDDSAIVQAARVSYGTGTKTVQQDEALIDYLMRHRHSTPFEMCEIKFHIKLPIFIARQWVRHRTANINEYSARYSILDKEFYIPSAEQLAPQSSQNHQGRANDQQLSPEQAAEVQHLLRRDAEQCYATYEHLLNGSENNDPVARELARMNLNLNYYTQWYWKIDLHNLFHFLALRSSAHAQYEIQEYARVMMGITKLWVPAAYKAFSNHRLGSVTLSKNALDAVKRMLAGEDVKQEDSKLGKREWGELIAILK